MAEKTTLICRIYRDAEDIAHPPSFPAMALAFKKHIINRRLGFALWPGFEGATEIVTQFPGDIEGQSGLDIAHDLDDVQAALDYLEKADDDGKVGNCAKDLIDLLQAWG